MRKMLYHLFCKFHNSINIKGIATFVVLMFVISQSATAQNITNDGGPISGTKTIGPSGDYSSLTFALGAINLLGLSGHTILELQSNYNSSGETFPLQFVNFTGLGASSTITVRPASGATGLSISGSTPIAIITFNNGDYITIDGRPGGSGTNRQLTITNSGSGPAVLFINDASYNTLKYCRIVASANTTVSSGVVLIGWSIGTTGNDNNTIDNCDINALGSACAITADGSGGAVVLNNDNIISNNNIRNFYVSATSTTPTYGINISSLSNGFIITGNSIYQEAARAYSSSGALQYGIYCDNISGNNFQITNNHIGGNSPGSNGTYTISSGYLRFYAVYIRVGSSVATSIQGNTIRGFDISSSHNSGLETVFGGIVIIEGATNVGNLTGNTIGSTSTNSISVSLTGAASGSTVTGIETTGGTPHLLQNNTIAGITLSAVSSVAYGNLFGITLGAPGAATVSNNTIGSSSGPLINNSGTGNVTTQYVTAGIRATAGNTTTGITISGNTINYLNMPAGATNTGATLYGMQFKSGGTVYTVTGNTIKNLTTGSTRTIGACLAGIIHAGPAAPTVFSGNKIHTLSNTATSAAVGVYGAILAGTSSGLYQFHSNEVHSLAISSSSTSAVMEGVYIGSGGYRLFNNMIRLGIDAGSGSVSGNFSIRGITNVSSTAQSIVFNSIYIGGTVSSSSVNTFGIRRAGVSATDSIYNNVVVNNRTNLSGTGKHYAISTSSVSGLEDNNIFYANGTGGKIASVDGGTTPLTTLNDYRTAYPGRNGRSIKTDPHFINPNGTSTTVNLHIMASPIITYVESQGSTTFNYLTSDFDGELRSGLTPVDIGADAGNFTAADNTPPVISYTALSNTELTTTRTLFATITDALGIPTSGAGLPVLYWKIGAGTYTAATGLFVSGSTYSFSFGSGVSANDVVSYYIVAQDLADRPNVNVNPLTGASGLSSDPPAVSIPPTSPSSYTILNTLSGSILVGTGGDYATLTSFVNAFNSSVLTGPLTVTLVNSDYSAGETFPIIINSISGSNSTNTVTIRPSGACTIAGSSTSAVIVINGADYLTIDGSKTGGTSRDLTISNTSTSTYAAVVWGQTGPGTNPVSNVTIKNCNITGNSNTTTLIGVGFGSSSIAISSTGTRNNNNTVQNCNIRKAQYGIFSQGDPFIKNTGTVITGNLVNSVSPNNVAAVGIYVGYEDGILITSNLVAGMNKGTNPDVFGISLGLSDLTHSATNGNTVTNATVSNNNVSNIVNTATCSAVGIVLGYAISGTTTISNNMVSGVSSNATSPDISIGIFLGGGAGSNTNVYQNSVWMNGTITGTSPGTQSSIAFAIAGSSPNVNIKNNIFRNTQLPNSGGTTKFFAIGLGYSSTTGNYTNLVSENNILDVSSGGGSYHLGITSGLESGTVRTAIADWRTETGRDLFSQQINPQFHGQSNLHVIPTSPANNAGTDLTGMVPLDYDGETRSVTPDIGADEFTAATATVAGSVTSPTISSYTPFFALTNPGGVEIYPNSYSTGASFTAQFFASGRTGSPPAGVTALSPYYWVVSSNASSLNINLRFNHDQISNHGIVDPFTVSLFKRDGTGKAWVEITSGIMRTSTSILLYGITSLSEFALGSNDNPLPVELVNFAGKAKNRNVILSWETKTEIDNLGFEVERKDKTGVWMKTAFVEGHGTSNAPKYYNFEDKKLASGKNFYRLKQIDSDGSFEYSDEVEVTIEVPTEFAMSQNYPNPFNPSTKVDYQLAGNSRVTIELYGMTGERVALLVSEEQEAGYYSMMIDAYKHQLSSGIYIYRMIATDATGKNFVATKKLSLIK